MTTPIRPERDERALAPADLWDAKVKEGLSPDQATAYVAKIHGPPPVAAEATAARARPTSSHSLASDLVGGASSVAQGMSGGLFDELAALEAGIAANPLHPLKNFEKLRAQANAPERTFAESHPVADAAGQVGGALLGGGLSGGVTEALAGPRAVATAATKLPLLTRAARAAKDVGTAAAVGAGVGAASGNGGLADRAESAVQGAKLGAEFGAGMKAGGTLLKATGVPALVRAIVPRPATEASPAARVLSAAGVSLASHERLAAQDLLADFDRSGLSIDDYLARAKANPGHPLYDLGPSLPQSTGSAAIRRDPSGDPLVRRTRGVQSIPSRGSAEISDFINSRAETRPSIVKGALEQGMGAQRENVVQSLEQEAADRSAASTDFYDTLRSHYDQAPKRITALDSHLGKPSFESAVKETENILRERDPQNFTPLTETNDKGVRRVRPLTFTEADLLKRSLDDVTDVAKVPNPIESGGVTKTRQRDMGSTGASVTDALDKAFPGNQKIGVPSYQDVRGQHADASAIINAHDSGRDFLKTSGDQLEVDFAKMSAPERQAYRHGALASIEDELSRSGNPGKLLNALTTRKLRTIFPDAQSYDNFELGLRKQVQGARNDAMVTGNSATARIQAEQSDLGGLGQVGHVASAASPRAMLSRLAESGVANRLRGMTEARVDALAPYLTASGPDLNNKLLYLKALQQEFARAASQSRLRGSRVAGQLAGSTAATP